MNGLSKIINLFNTCFFNKMISFELYEGKYLFDCVIFCNTLYVREGFQKFFKKIMENSIQGPDPPWLWKKNLFFFLKLEEPQGGPPPIYEKKTSMSKNDFQTIWSKKILKNIGYGK